MKSLYLFGLFLTLVYNASCFQANTNKSNIQEWQKINTDTSMVAVIRFEQAGIWPFPNNYTPTTLTYEEIKSLDNLIKSYTKSYTDSLKGNLREAYGVDFQKFKYKRQYVPVINEKGEKEVWANFFCGIEDERWRDEIVLVDDGGNCYFNMKVNLTTRTCYALSVNGYA